MTTTIDAVLTLAHAAGPPAAVEFWTVGGLTALATLAALEIVLGIDNVVFISVLADRLPEEKRARVRTIGLLLAMVMRIGLLFVAGWLMTLDDNALFELLGREFTIKDLVLVLGGLFLLGKATVEIHHMLRPAHETGGAGAAAAASVGGVLTQIIALDLVFSLDSVITAVGMVQNMAVIVVAIMAAVAVMLFFAGPVGRFVSRHPSMKMLALSFLVLIGVLLIAEGVEQKIERGYVYSAMAFALIVELLNMRVDALKQRARERRAGAKA